MTYIPSDPLFSQQWHLQNNVDGLLDLNIVDVWDDYTGAGIDVAVIDDAVQRTHPDLDENYSRVKDWDFSSRDTDPSGTDIESHGTAVAGIISANEGNGIGGVGIAYNSTLFGFRGISFQNMADAINNASGQQQQQEGVGGGPVNREADVVNISIGTKPRFFFDIGLDLNSLNTAINNAVISGRGGLGTILVKSADNSRDVNQDTNASSWNANPRTISAAAINQDGFVASYIDSNGDTVWYSTHGASILVSAFGTPGEVVTTDRTGSGGSNINGDYRNDFNGTSAAAPMVSGVVALMLEANPDLGWRDVQDILAYSARHVGSDIGSTLQNGEEYAWRFNGANNWNGGGLHFSNDYGFGLVDAKAAVRMAETWDSVAQTSANAVSLSEDFLDSTTTIETTGTAFSRSISDDIDVEHVEVDVSFTQWHDLGDLEVRLVSPSGTSSILIDNSGENDDSSDGGFGAGRWKFYSNAFRGEKTSGTWSIQLIDGDDNQVSPITVNDIDITFLGEADSLSDTFIFTNEYSDYAGIFGHQQTVDGGDGIDTLNASAVDSDITLNLASRQGKIDGTAINVLNIETIFTGDGDDRVIGNTANNMLVGMRGNDYLDGGSGTDTLKGGEGNDEYVVDNLLDQVIEVDGEGTDVVYTHIDYTLADNVENMTMREPVYRGTGNLLDNRILGNSTNNLIEGAEGNDRLYGFNGNDTLKGGDDDDYIVGGFGTDVMYGGLGDDEFTVYVETDQVIEAVGEGTDVVYTHVDYTLADNVENMTLRESVRRGTGNLLDNGILGNSANNLIDGAGGNDRLYGFDGNDTLRGGADSDYLDGGRHDDQLIGEAGDDKLIGYDGDDLLAGGMGNDTLSGGTGADAFIFNAFTEGIDRIVDFSQAQNDKINLLLSGFKSGLSKGILESGQFVLGVSSASADTRLIYDQGTGGLHFDPDGTGAAASTQIAVLTNRADLTYDDVFIA